ncbi:MAG TPA: hypothetical protein VMT86_16550 [Bryobacteraceae bacterium]|nr:hypothetical protein [Bryobacteraceae bacterium]
MPPSGPEKLQSTVSSPSAFTSYRLDTTGAADGGSPSEDLYGTTYYGGPANLRVVYKVDTGKTSPAFAALPSW